MRSSAMSAALVFMLVSPSYAGVVFEIESTHGGVTESVEVSVEGRNLKMGIPAGGDSSDGEAIYRGERREMVMVDHGEKSYMVIDEAMMKSVSAQLSSAEAQIQEALKNVPADQRAMVEQMMKQRMPQQAQAPAKRNVSINKTGERGARNGYDTVRYDVMISGRKTQELWVAPWDEVEGGEEALDAFHDMAAFFTELRESTPFFGGGDDGDNNVFEYMKELDGFPVVTVDYDASGNVIGESSLKSSRKQSIDSAVFEPPAGYKRRQMPGF